MDDQQAAPGFLDLCLSYVERGDLRRAALAAWAADVHALEALLWENGLAQAPDPLGQLAAVGESVAAAIETLATQPRDGASVRAVVEAAREAMVTAFDASVHGLLSDRLADLARLDEAASGPVERPGDRLGGRSADELALELRSAAADCAAMASLLAAEGEHEAAGRLDDQADAASFEAYLVEAAVRAGDLALVTADLRWDLALERVGDGGLVRDDLLAVVGTAEQEQLRRVWDLVR